jgi:hypothetical protein
MIFAIHLDTCSKFYIFKKSQNNLQFGTESTAFIFSVRRVSSTLLISGRQRELLENKILELDIILLVSDCICMPFSGGN